VTETAADPEGVARGGANGDRHLGPRSSASVERVGAMIKAPKAPRGVGSGEGVSTSPLGIWGGVCGGVPFPIGDLRRFKKASFGAFWVLF